MSPIRLLVKFSI